MLLYPFRLQHKSTKHTKVLTALPCFHRPRTGLQSRMGLSAENHSLVMLKSDLKKILCLQYRVEAPEGIL